LYALGRLIHIRCGAVALQEAVEALARAGLRNPVKVAVAVTAAPAAAADGSNKKRRQQDGQQQEGAAAAAGAALEQKTPTSLSLEYIMCSVDEKLPQLVSTCYRTCHITYSTCRKMQYMLHLCALLDAMSCRCSTSRAV
jgi:hypothetical protein